MSHETCVECDQPLRLCNCAAACERCGEEGCEAEYGRKEALACRDRELALLRSKLSTAEAKMVEAERENKAWRALATRYDGAEGALCCLQDDGSWSALGFDRGERGAGPDVQTAAIDLATKLGLLDKEGG